MKIADIKVIVASPGRNFVTVKVLTDEGLYGVGDATVNGRELAVATYLAQRYGFVEGVDLLAVGRPEGQVHGVGGSLALLDPQVGLAVAEAYRASVFNERAVAQGSERLLVKGAALRHIANGQRQVVDHGLRKLAASRRVRPRPFGRA